VRAVEELAKLKVLSGEVGQQQRANKGDFDRGTRVAQDSEAKTALARSAMAASRSPSKTAVVEGGREQHPA